MDIDGKNVRRASDDRRRASHLSWSPDGNSLVYLSWDDDLVGVVRLVDLSTGVTRSLTPEDEVVGDPVLSWDGKHIAFATPDYRYVDAMALDGRQRWRATAGLRGDSFAPAWTPDGGISFLWYHDGGYHIGVTGLRGGGVESITDIPRDPSDLAWYNPDWFHAGASEILLPKLWARLKQ
jgi:Tol biopolymer transport system component